MFGKNIKVQVKYIDLDKDNEVITTSDEITGKKGERIDYSPQETIDQLLDKGYVLANNPFADDDQVFTEDMDFNVSFNHDHAIVDPSHPGFGYKKEDLEKKVKQVVSYNGAASRTPETSVQELTFEHLYEIDKVTGDVIADRGFEPEKQSFMIVGTPTLPGFIPDKAFVGGDTVSAEDDDKEYTVEFKINKVPSSLTQNAIIKYVDIANENKVIETVTLDGQPNMPIEYDPDQKIKQLAEEGYVLVNNGFNAGGDIQFFGNANDYEPVFIITMKYVAEAVSSEHPNENVDKSEYEAESSFTVEFTGADDKNPDSKKQTAHWSRTVTYIPSSKKVVQNGLYDTPWKADIDEYQAVDIPVIDGYHTGESKVEAPELSLENKEATVKYIENGRLVPVDQDGKEIEGAPHPYFTTDPDDSAKITAEEIVPDVDGYHAKSMTVTPGNPDSDMQVVYEKDDQDDVMYVNLGKHDEEEQETEPATSATAEDETEQKEADAEHASSEEKQEPAANNNETTEANDQMQAAQEAIKEQESNAEDEEDKSKLKNQIAIVNFIDIDHNGASLTSSGPLVGKPGDSINDLYSTEIPLKVIKQAGYRVVFNNFDSDGFVQRFDNNDLMTQVFTIGVTKKPINGEEIKKPSDDDIIKNQLTPKVKELEKTKETLEKIRPTLVNKDASSNPNTVSRLLDIITALLNMNFVMQNNQNESKEKNPQNEEQLSDEEKN